MATRIISKRDLVGLQSLSFIRPQRITFSVRDAKPTTQLYAFFDGVSVDQYITSAVGGQPKLKTDVNGNYDGYFDIPAGTFNTGTRIFRVQESSTYDSTAIAGSSLGGAQTVFTANGLKQTWQDTVTSINQITVVIPAPPPPPPRNRDPLAQSFFTYGVTGGCFITSIDLYFATKDASIPCTLEVRELVNGYPSDIMVNPLATVTLNPSQINVSTDQKNNPALTRFTFPVPIYLRENGEFCFVLLANTNQYTLWTSKLGEKSQETGKSIFEQPYIGSLFKSENNITWSAHQTEDIKFTINKAVFNTAQKTITGKARVPASSFDGNWLSVTAGSAVVTATLPFEHAFNTGDKIYLTGNSANTYRGITNSVLCNASGWAVTVLNRNSFTFTVSSNATSTGTLSSSGKLEYIEIVNAGSGYSDGTYLLTMNTPAGGTPVDAAQGTVVISGGKAVSTTVSVAGSRYTSSAPITIASGLPTGGTGLQLIPNYNSSFTAAIPMRFQELAPIVPSLVPDGSSMTMTAVTSPQSSRAPGSAQVIENGKFLNVGKDAILANNKIDTGGTTTVLGMTLSSNNPNLSPVIDKGNRPRIRTKNSIINDASNNYLESGIVTVTGTSITGVGTKFTASDIGRKLYDYNNTLVGTISAVASNTAATLASTALVPISNGVFSLSGDAGNALSRYISKKVSLEIPSKGARVFVTAMSMLGSAFEVYIRTSSSTSTVPHENSPWTKMSCTVSSTDRSANINDFKEYEFQIENLAPFDVYSIKIVLYSQYKYQVPKIDNYRAIILAT